MGRGYKTQGLLYALVALVGLCTTGCGDGWQVTGGGDPKVENKGGERLAMLEDGGAIWAPKRPFFDPDRITLSEARRSPNTATPNLPFTVTPAGTSEPLVDPDGPADEGGLIVDGGAGAVQYPKPGLRVIGVISVGETSTTTKVVGQKTGLVSINGSFSLYFPGVFFDPSKYMHAKFVLVDALNNVFDTLFMTREPGPSRGRLPGE